MKIELISLLLTIGSMAQAATPPQGPVEGIHSEDAEYVCHMNDFLQTDLFVDVDTTLDEATNVYSTKIIEVPRVNAGAWNGKTFLVQVVSVQRQAGDVQTIVYRPTMPSDILNKLELQRGPNGQLRAVQTLNVDAKGKPTAGSVVNKGVCEANEPY